MLKSKLGEVVKLRGFKGEIVVNTRFKDVEIFRTIKNVSIEENIYKVLDFKNLKNRVGLLLETINNEDKARNFIGKEVYYDRSEVNYNRELLLEDMFDFTLVDNNGNEYGQLEDIENYGAGNLLIVNDKGKEIILPENKGFILGYDKDKCLIIVDEKLIKEVME